MFVAVYRFKIKPGKLEDFKKAWAITTEGIEKEYGGLGSRLHSTENELVFIAYAQWPSREKWKEPKPTLSENYEFARRQMRMCVEESETLHELEVVEDLLC